jgi:hypothetical protein
MAGRSVFTMSVWASATSERDNGVAIGVSNSTFVAADEINLYPYEAVDSRCRFYMNGGSRITAARPSSVTTDNKMHHFCVTQLYASLRIMFIDGIEVGRDTTTSSISSSVVRGYIGDSVWGGNFLGSVSEVMFHIRALTEPEVRLLSRRPGIAYETKRQRRGYVAAGGGFSPYWASQRSQIIGGGMR